MNSSGNPTDNGEKLNHSPYADHVALARSRTWNGGDPWQFIAYCRLLLGLPEDGPAPFGLIDDAIHGKRK